MQRWEGFFPVINALYTDEKSEFKFKTIKAIIVVKTLSRSFLH
jgi:hypothetical protein